MKSKFYRFILFVSFFILALLLLYFIDLPLRKQKHDQQSPDFSACRMTWIPATHPLIQYCGRINKMKDHSVRFAHSGCSVKFRFSGTRVHIYLKNFSSDPKFYHSNYFNVCIDTYPVIILHATNDSFQYKFEGLPQGEHTFELFKRTEAACGLVELKGFFLDSMAKILPSSARPRLKIEFVGNSITAGYGNEGSPKEHKFNPLTENHYYAYPAICSRLLNAEFHSICYSGKGVFRNYDKSTNETIPELYTKIYPQKKNYWNFTSWQPDFIVINAGTNDFAQGIPPADSFIYALTRFLIKVRQLNPEAKIILADGPLLKDNLKKDSLTSKPVKTYSVYMSYLKQAINNYKALGYKSIYSISLTPVGQRGYGTNWHPNVAQHQKNAEELATFISSLMIQQ